MKTNIMYLLIVGEKMYQTKHIPTILVLLAYAVKEDIFADELLMAWIPLAPDKVIYSAIEREDSRGYIDYGVSMRSGWLTEKGEEKLNNLMKTKRANHEKRNKKRNNSRT